MSRIETLRQAVIDAELNTDSSRSAYESACRRVIRMSKQLERAIETRDAAHDEFKLAFDLLQTAQREHAEATRGTEVAL